MPGFPPSRAEARFGGQARPGRDAYNLMITKKRKKRKSGKGLFGAIVTLLIVLSVIVFLFATNWKIEQRRDEVSAKSRFLQQEVAKLEAQRQNLESKISAFENDEYLEKEARENLQLKKKGEEVVTIIVPETTGESTQAVEEPSNFWQKLLENLGFTATKD